MKGFKYVFFLGSLLVLFSSFAFNIFGVGVNSSWFADFEQGSARIVKKTADCKGDQNFYSGPLLYKNYHGDDSVNLESCSEADLAPYVSQFGLQSRLIAFFAPVSPDRLDEYFKFTELFLALLSAVLFAIMSVKIKKQFGTVAAVSVVILIAMSPWLVGYARNIYWVLPFMIAPFIVTYCIYDRLRTTRHFVLFYMLIGSLFVLKLLNGYEHSTTMVISVFAAIVFNDYRHSKAALIRLIKPLLFVGLTAFSSFVIAFSVNIVGLNEYYHNMDKSIQAVTNRAGARGGSISSIKEVQPNVMYAFKITLPDVYQAINYYHNLEAMNDGKSSPISYLSINIMNYALLPAINIPVGIKGIFGVIIQSVTFVGIVGYLCARRIHDIDLRNRLIAAGAVGLAGALSWLILMPAHAYPHAFLNGIIFYIPFLIFVYTAIGISLGSVFKARTRKLYGKKR